MGLEYGEKCFMCGDFVERTGFRVRVTYGYYNDLVEDVYYCNKCYKKGEWLKKYDK